MTWDSYLTQLVCIDCVVRPHTLHTFTLPFIYCDSCLPFFSLYPKFGVHAHVWVVPPLQVSIATTFLPVWTVPTHPHIPPCRTLPFQFPLPRTHCCLSTCACCRLCAFPHAWDYCVPAVATLVADSTGGCRPAQDGCGYRRRCQLPVDGRTPNVPTHPGCRTRLPPLDITRSGGIAPAFMPVALRALRWDCGTHNHLSLLPMPHTLEPHARSGDSPGYSLLVP